MHNHPESSVRAEETSTWPPLSARDPEDIILGQLFVWVLMGDVFRPQLHTSTSYVPCLLYLVYASILYCSICIILRMIITRNNWILYLKSFQFLNRTVSRKGQVANLSPSAPPGFNRDNLAAYPWEMMEQDGTIRMVGSFRSSMIFPIFRNNWTNLLFCRF